MKAFRHRDAHRDSGVRTYTLLGIRLARLRWVVATLGAHNFERLVVMKLTLTACFAVSCIAFVPGLAEAKGCLKGAAVGGIGGHVAGHHGLIGAAAGCAVGHHLANKKQNVATPAATPAPAPAAPVQPAPAKT